MEAPGRPAASRAAIVVVLVAVVIVASMAAYVEFAGSLGGGAKQESVTVSAIPPSPLISPGQVQNYSLIEVAAVGQQVGAVVTLKAFSPGGVTFVMNQSSVTVSASPQRIPVVITAKSGITVGNYSVVIEVSGQGIAPSNQSLRVEVVPMLVLMKYPSFYPRNVTVAKGPG